MSEVEPKFEDQLAKLEKLVTEMESGTLPLDAMASRFEEGQRLVAACTQELEAFRQRIEKVTSTNPVKTEPLNV